MRYMKTFFPVFTIVLIYSLILLMSSIPIAQGADDGINFGWKWEKEPGEKPEWGVGAGVTISTGTLTDIWEKIRGGDDDTDSESCDSDKPDWAKDSGSCDSPSPSESSSDPESSSEDDEEESPSGGDMNIENFGNVEGDDNEVENKITIKISK